VACHSPLYQVSSFPPDEANSIASSGSTKEGPLTTLAGLADVPATSMLGSCLSGEFDPWSVFNLRSQVGDHDFVSADGLQQLGCLGDFFDELDSSLDLCCYENHFLLDTESTYSELLPRRNFTELVPIPDCASSYSAIHNDHEDYTDEMIALRNRVDLTVKLAEYQYYQAKVARHGESSQQILKKEFELAKAAERCGESGKAEYHCRRILRQSPVIDVQTFLGMILAHSARPEESIFRLFSALAEFIIQFDVSSLETNIRLWKPIEYLFCELLLLTEQNWDSLVSGFFKMKDTFSVTLTQQSTCINVFLSIAQLTWTLSIPALRRQKLTRITGFFYGRRSSGHLGLNNCSWLANLHSNQEHQTVNLLQFYIATMRTSFHN
jgi:hypothetical protein